MIISKTPYRISFFGGGSDYPQWYLKNGGEVISTTIDKYIYLSCRNLPPFFNHKHRIVWSKVELVKNIKENIQKEGVKENLQKENFPELSDDINELKESWNKLEKAKKTNYGEMAVNSFFNKAADLLEEMNTNTPDGTVSASYVGSDSTQYSTKGDTIKMKKQ